ncbi:MAG: LamG-like jellyroll fold domain-containing protein [Flavobacterium sp.]
MKKMTLLKKQILLLALLLVSSFAIGQTPASALDFDGSNDFVQLGNIMPATYTKEAWFYVSNLGLQNNLISGGSDGQHALYPSTHNGTWNAVQDPTPIVVNTWYHVALTYDAATTTMKLYKNGNLVATNTNVPPFIGGNALRLGSYDASQNLLGGKLDEVRIWNRVLQQCEIQSNMNGELPSGQVGLVAYYKCNQGIASANNTSITSLTDASGNNNTGTLNGFSLTGTTSNWVASGGVVTGTMSPAPLSVTSPQVFCSGATVAGLTATGTNIKWYNVATNGTALLSTATLATATYYVTQTLGTCESPRTAVTVTVNTTALPIATTPQTLNNGATVANLAATGTNLKWYVALSGGTALVNTTVITAGTYYVSQTVSSCESLRRAVQVTINGAGLDFDGANDYVQLGNIMPATYTKEAWFYVSNLGLQNNLISGGADGEHALYSSVTYGNRLSAGHNGTWNAVQDPTPIVANTWYHVALTYDAATTTMKLYKNGNLVATNTSVPPFIGGNTVRLGSYDVLQNLLGGKLDEVRIWNRALPQAEIQNNMNCELPSGQTGLIAYYKFNQGIDNANNAAINTLTDASGNANNGTLTNFALNGTSSNWEADSVIASGVSCQPYLSAVSFDDVDFKYYPNPVLDVLNLNAAAEISKVQIINLLGQEVISKSLNAKQGQIDVQFLAPGTYLVRVTSEDKVKIVKIIKQ